MEKIPVLAIVGPTASGKTALAVALAKRYGAEIVSADSMQIYRGMDIATAKPDASEMQGVPHHLLGFLPPGERYSVAAFCADAERAIAGIVSRGKNVIVCGGTGLYVDALLSGMRFPEERESEAVHARLSEKCAREGLDALFAELQAVDPEMAQTIDRYNEKRVLRALQIYYATGEKPSLVRARALRQESPYQSLYIGLFFEDRRNLYNRIDQRVDRMLAAGLAEEAKAFFASPVSQTAAQAIGYKELKPYLCGEAPLEAAADQLKRATHRYAKRQLTWFARNPSIRPIYRDRLTDAAVEQAAAAIVDETKLFSGGNVHEYDQGILQ